MSWNFVRFHEILNQTDAENFSFLSWKTKNKKCTKSTGLFSTKRWPLDVLTFLIHGFDKNMNKDSKGPKVTRNDYFQLVMKVALTFVFLSWKALPCHGGHAVC